MVKPEKFDHLHLVYHFTVLLKVTKNEWYRLSHKMTKNTFMALFLIIELLQT